MQAFPKFVSDLFQMLKWYNGTLYTMLSFEKIKNFLVFLLT